MGDDPSMMADMHALHFLLDNRADIRRIVAVLPNGIDTLTESDKPEIAATLKTHVAAMYARRYAARPTDGDRRIADLARKLATGLDRPALQTELLGLLSREPEPVRGFAEGLLGVSATGAARAPARGGEGLV